MERSQIAGYQLEGTLGEGGMGVVYRGRDKTLDRPVAIKVIHSNKLGPDGKSRFLREARACSKINHPNIITVYAAGDDDGYPYLAMELIDGATLREVISEGPIEWEKATRWIVDLLDALRCLHEDGIVHRDLKPENIMVTKDGIIKLMDFGLAHLQSSTTLTQEGTTLGTAPYMSPEQVMGKKADARSDLFSMATVFYEMLTGAHPFRGEHPMAVMYSIQNETPKPIEVHGLDCPAGLQDVLDKAFIKELDNRFQSAGGFQEELAALLQGGKSDRAGSADRGLKSTLIPFVVIAVVAITAALLAWNHFTREGTPANDRELAIHHNEIGQSLQDKEDYAGAAAEYRKAILADQTYAGARSNLGLILWQQEGDLTQAESLFRKAIDLDPKAAIAMYNLGDLRLDMGDSTEAETMYRQAIAVNDTLAAAYNNLGAILINSGRLDEARVVIESGLALDLDQTYRAAMLQKQSRLDSLLSR